MLASLRALPAGTLACRLARAQTSRDVRPIYTPTGPNEYQNVPRLTGLCVRPSYLNAIANHLHDALRVRDLLEVGEALDPVDVSG